jgi:hypothetical protein
MVREKHNMAHTRIYRTWCNMKGRCYRKTAKRYDLYGGRGIKVCDEWKNSFIAFYKWSIENGYQEDLTIDRIDVNGNYEPNNCRWISNFEQQSNRTDNRFIKYKGKTKTLSEWSRIYNLNLKTLQKRINKGWDLERAFNTRPLDRDSEYRKGKYDKRSKPIAQYDKDGNIIKIWSSLGEIKREKGYSTCSIMNICKHKPTYNYAYNYKWEYYNEL